MHGRGVVTLLGLGLVACRTDAPPPSTPVAAAEPPAAKRVIVRDIVQPVKNGGGVNEPNGAEDGMIDGPLTGAVAAPPPPPPPAPPQFVAPRALDANRIAGEKNIIPDDDTKTEIARAGKDKLVGSFKLCITEEGNINTVSRLKSTTFPAYDQKIMSTIRGEWRYRPFLVNGEPTPVCTAVTFIYSQAAPAPPPASPPPLHPKGPERG